MFRRFTSLAALSLVFAALPSQAGLIVGYHQWLQDAPARDNTPNLQTPGVSASMVRGVPINAQPAAQTPGGGAFLSAQGSTDGTYGAAGPTGDNTPNGFFAAPSIPSLTGGLFFLELINTTAVPLVLNSLVYDLARLTGGIADITFEVSWSRRAPDYSLLSPYFTSSQTIPAGAPNNVWKDYSADLAGMTLAQNEKLVVIFRRSSVTSGVIGFDNIAVDGAFALTAVPETSTVTGLGVFLGLAASFRARRRSVGTTAA